ncbi:MAG: protein kinase, partial [Actinomycetota bacterium]|nr:protein kinase [Actinomycetota bacterium]
MNDDDITCIPVAVSQDLTVYPPAVVPGQLLGDRYEVGERIGGGGMADVFRARDRLLRRNVAVKVMKPHLVSEGAYRRMLREARATAALEHPHILRVSDFGAIGTSAYIVTELLTGLSLSDLLKVTPGHRLDWRAALTLLLPALDALDRA